MDKNIVNKPNYQTLVEGIPAVTYIRNLDNSFSFTYISPQIVQLLGWTPDEWCSIPGVWVNNLLPEDHLFGKEDYIGIVSDKRSGRLEYRMLNREGKVVWVQDDFVIQLDSDGHPELLMGILLDITRRKEKELALYDKVYRDPLTGLSNRNLIIEKLDNLLSLPEYPHFALVSIDLDRFTSINDSLGNETGDFLLVSVAQRLKKLFGAEQTFSRMGGDEFIVLSEGENAHQEVLRLSDKILSELQNPFEIEEKIIFTSASLGVVIGTSDYKDPESILSDAEFATHRAKKRGRGCYEIFAPALRNKEIDFAHLENLLLEAIERNEFRLYFQPIISLRDNQITGFEALIRWITPQFGMILPSEFIPLAEKIGLSQNIDHWVMQEATHQVKYWQDRYGNNTPYTISVNLTGSLLQNKDTVSMIKDVVIKSGLPASSLRIELTERVFLKSNQTMVTILEDIRKLGVQLQIDDFGTGYSSLAYLQRFPINAIKIDRSFVNRVGAQESGSEIVQAIIVLANELGMDTIAEGIESIEQLHWLKKANCDYGQGYLLYKPMDAESIENILLGLNQPEN